MATHSPRPGKHRQPPWPVKRQMFYIPIETWERWEALFGEFPNQAFTCSDHEQEVAEWLERQGPFCCLGYDEYLCIVCNGDLVRISPKQERRKLTPKVRFIILKRDDFTCQYCGQSAPSVELEVDHIVPISRGGITLEQNLITACKECNIGKGAKRL